MPRRARVVLPGYLHHITHRGVRKLDIFQTNEDRLVYLNIFRHAAEKHDLKIAAYCLMTNHVHFVALPAEENSMAFTIRDAHRQYALYFNSRNSVKGHLFEYHYFSCPMDHEHAIAAVRYVERNPVDAGLISRPEHYAWSSASSHVFENVDPLLDFELTKRLKSQIGNWRKWLQSADEKEKIVKMERHISAGVPLGSKKFIDFLEKNNICCQLLLPGQKRKERGKE